MFAALSEKRTSWSGKSCVEMLNGYRYPKPVVGYNTEQKAEFKKNKPSEKRAVFYSFSAPPFSIAVVDSNGNIM